MNISVMSQYHIKKIQSEITYIKLVYIQTRRASLIEESGDNTGDVATGEIKPGVPLAEIQPRKNVRGSEILNEKSKGIAPCLPPFATSVRRERDNVELRVTHSARVARAHTHTYLGIVGYAGSTAYKLRHPVGTHAPLSRARDYEARKYPGRSVERHASSPPRCSFAS